MVGLREEVERLMCDPPPRRSEVAAAVADATWQVFRESLRGLREGERLQRLWVWKWEHGTRKADVQVHNYVNALKRGGLI